MQWVIIHNISYRHPFVSNDLGIYFMPYQIPMPYPREGQKNYAHIIPYLVE